MFSVKEPTLPHGNHVSHCVLVLNREMLTGTPLKWNLLDRK